MIIEIPVLHCTVCSFPLEIVAKSQDLTNKPDQLSRTNNANPIQLFETDAYTYLRPMVL